MGFKVAFASSDGEFSDLHLGQAEAFYVYRIDEEGMTLLQKREVESLSVHSENEFARLYGLLADCKAVVAAKVGLPVATYFIERGLRVFESEFAIKDILGKLQEEHTLEGG